MDYTMSFTIITKSAGLSWNDADIIKVDTLEEVIAHCSSMNATYTTVKCAKWKNVNTASLLSNEYVGSARMVTIKLQKESGKIFDNDELYQLETALSDRVQRGFNGNVSSWYQRL